VRILIITDHLPYPLILGDRIRVYNLIRPIARQHQVSLVGFLQTPDEADGVSHMQEFCHWVETANLRRRHPLVHLPGLLRYALTGRPSVESTRLIGCWISTEHSLSRSQGSPSENLIHI